MTVRRWGIAIIVLLAATIAMAKLPHGMVTELNRPLQTFPLEMVGWHGFEQPLSDRISTAAGVDSYLSRFYFQPGGDSVGLYVGYYKSQQTGETIHSPKNCLPGTGWQPLQASEIMLRAPSGRTVPVNLYIVENEREKLLVLYWYQSHGRIVSSEYWAKIYMVLDAIRINRTDSTLVRVTTKLGHDEDKARQLAVSFAEQVIPNLDQIIPQ
ncbi:MAG: exosortase C-terminal domain/associated protein EpsI [Candidatus Korobacteraceae bacterium]|jgi:EpsI family protein